MMFQSHRQILLIDDAPEHSAMLARHLQGRGFSVALHADGKNAMAWLQHNLPIAIVSEIQSEAIDGFSILSHIQQSSPDIPVIFVSKMKKTERVIEALRQGAVDYLLKPVGDMEVLDIALDRALERSELLLRNHVYRQELEQANRELKEYVRVLERDQKAGRRVQSKLLPETPAKFGDIKIDYKLIPSLYLSGDFIDFGCIADRYLAFYLTDVSGHGAASAFVTVWLKQLVRRFFREKKAFHTLASFRDDAAKLMAIINQEVIHSGVGCHMTCFVGVIDTQTREMRYVFGGHLPFPVLLSGNKAEYLTGKGKPLGIFPDAKWEVYSIDLPRDFSILVFSDGVLEIIGDEELIDKENTLLELVRENSTTVDSLLKALDIADVDSVPDDIAILKVESHPTG